MNQDQALSVLIQAARVAQSKGAFTLEDAKVIAEAIAVFVPAQAEAQAEVQPETQNEVTAEPVTEESGN
jgi:hypothetical protein